MAAGYIAPRNSKGGGDLPLRQRNRTAKSIAESDDLGFPGSQFLLDQSVQADGVVPVMQIVQHGVLHANDVDQLQRVSLFVHLDGIGK